MPEGDEFWGALGDAGGDAALYIDPGNMGGPSFDRLAGGNEAGIADRVLSFLAELDDQQRDAETTAWHVLLARRRLHQTEDDRKRFLDAWGNA
ncbi:hypothetical protein [Streptomyces sp. NBC_00076]|uniref:hypothetical protein n=1 Tax=Streptomyces sp. NBC_00076 TaxID=2975642 RepID=UPI00324D3135